MKSISRGEGYRTLASEWAPVTNAPLQLEILHEIKRVNISNRKKIKKLQPVGYGCHQPTVADSNPNHFNIYFESIFIRPFPPASFKTFKLGRFTSKIYQHNFQIYSASLQSGRGGRVEVKKYLLLGRWSDKSPPQRLRRARKGREVRTRVTIVSCFNYLRLHRHKGR